eukprot:1124402-Rhodomonas_salina.1
MRAQAWDPEIVCDDHGIMILILLPVPSASPPPHPFDHEHHDVVLMIIGNDDGWRYAELFGGRSETPRGNAPRFGAEAEQRGQDR